jgi:hypothetical protein
MAEEKEAPKGTAVPISRLFEQPPDASSFYSDFGQVFNTGNEVVIQFYETIPGPPGPDAQIRNVRSRLRATVTVSISHARNIGKLLVEKTEKTEEVKK